MNDNNTTQPDFNARFKEKIEELKDTIIPLGKDPGTSCAALTLTHILDVLDREDLRSHYFNNLAIPFSGLASYTSKNNWKGACGAVGGAMAAIGVIMGGHEEAKSNDVPKIYAKAVRFASKFENQFGSLSCEDICGVNTSQNIREYVKNRVWENKCVNFVLFAVEQVGNLTKKDLDEKWK